MILENWTNVDTFKVTQSIITLNLADILQTTVCMHSCAYMSLWPLYKCKYDKHKWISEKML